MNLEFITRKIRRLCDKRIRGDDWIGRHLEMKSIAGTFPIGLIGDSHMERIAPFSDSINMGLGGDKVENVIWRIEDGLLNNKKIGTLYVCCGANDIINGESLSKTIGAYDTLIYDRLSNHPSIGKLVVIKVPPLNQNFPNTTATNAKISSFNQYINCVVADSMVFDINGWIEDGLHLDQITNETFIDCIRANCSGTEASGK